MAKEAIVDHVKRLKQYLGKASFATEADRDEAFKTLTEIERELAARATEIQLSRLVSQPACSHIWVSMAPDGGRPRFRLERRINPLDPVAAVLCERCGMRSWFTERKWDSIDLKRRGTST